MKELADLRIAYAHPDLARLKLNAQIVVIDDQDFSFLDILNRNHYRITKHDDISDLKLVETYDIVLCDIRGVGRKLNAKLQGVHVAKEIKKLYPFKPVIIFTASSLEPEIAASFRDADFIMRKDADEEEWIETLDACLKKLGDPIQHWITIRSYLLEKNVSTKDVALLESDYVKAMLKKDKQYFTNRLSSSQKISPEVRDVLTKFISAVVVKFLIAS